MTDKRPEPMLWLDSNRGVYIPQHFAQSFADRAKSVQGVSDETWTTLEAGPDADNEWYWEAWDELENNAIVTDENGIRYHVCLDGDCWLIPDGMPYDEKSEWYTWPKEDATDGD